MLDTVSMTRNSRRLADLVFDSNHEAMTVEWSATRTWEFSGGKFRVARLPLIDRGTYWGASGNEAFNRMSSARRCPPFIKIPASIKY